MAGTVWLDSARHGLARIGMAGKAGRGMAWLGAEWQAWQGEAGHARAWIGRLNNSRPVGLNLKTYEH